MGAEALNVIFQTADSDATSTQFLNQYHWRFEFINSTTMAGKSRTISMLLLWCLTLREIQSPHLPQADASVADSSNATSPWTFDHNAISIMYTEHTSNIRHIHHGFPYQMAASFVPGSFQRPIVHHLRWVYRRSFAKVLFWKSGHNRPTVIWKGSFELRVALIHVTSRSTYGRYAQKAIWIAFLTNSNLVEMVQLDSVQRIRPRMSRTRRLPYRLDSTIQRISSGPKCWRPKPSLDLHSEMDVSGNSP